MTKKSNVNDKCKNLVGSHSTHYIGQNSQEIKTSNKKVPIAVNTVHCTYPLFCRVEFSIIVKC